MLQLSNLMGRLYSFTNWPSRLQTSTLSSPSVLANAGFMYTGNGDEVTCLHCQLKIDGWTRANVNLLHPRDEHRKRSPHCSLAQQLCPARPTVNVYQYQQADSTNQQLVNSTSFKGTDQSDYIGDLASVTPSTFAARSIPVDTYKISVKPDDCDHGISQPPSMPSHYQDRAVRTQPAALISPSTADLRISADCRDRQALNRSNPEFDYDKFRHERHRLDTFYDWPSTAPVKPAELAADGWIYTGQADRVRCAFCRHILHNWAKNDRPATEHRRHFPDCAFVQGRDVGNVRIETNDTSAAAAALPVIDKLVADGQRRKSPNPKVVHDHSRIQHKTTDQITSRVDVDMSDSARDEEEQLWLENKRLKDIKTCKVCMDNEVNTVFLPCGHLVACNNCSPQLRNCPICRTYIRGTVKTSLV